MKNVSLENSFDNCTTIEPHEPLSSTKTMAGFTVANDESKKSTKPKKKVKSNLANKAKTVYARSVEEFILSSKIPTHCSEDIRNQEKKVPCSVIECKESRNEENINVQSLPNEESPSNHKHTEELLALVDPFCDFVQKRFVERQKKFHLSNIVQKRFRELQDECLKDSPKQGCLSNKDMSFLFIKAEEEILQELSADNATNELRQFLKEYPDRFDEIKNNLIQKGFRIVRKEQSHLYGPCM